MSTGICSCGTPTFGNLGDPNCVISQSVLAMPIFIPRYKADGTRNTIDLAVDPLTYLNPAGIAGDYATLGAYIRDRVENSEWDAQERLYPSPRIEEPSFERTDVIYEVAASTTKYATGLGGVRTWNMQLWGDSATYVMYRELKKFGCSALDVFYIDINGAIWGIKDDETTSVIRGYEMGSNTWEVFKQLATSTTVAKLNITFDLSNSECEENSYAITATELGYQATTLRGLISAYIDVDNTDLSTVVANVKTSYGTAKTASMVVGLDDADFIVTDALGTVLPHTGTVENPNGTYTIAMTSPLTVTDIYTVKVVTPTYDVTNGTFTA